MIPDPARYTTLVFDCDGVILESNRVKTEAFRTAAAPWGAAAAEALVAHHVANGGISRYEKFVHFLEHIVPAHAPTAKRMPDDEDLNRLLDAFAETVRQGLMSSTVAPGLAELRAATPQTSWCVVSGGDQEELREVFVARSLARLFDGGIFGSPDTKDEILAREIRAGKIRRPALFLGDSRYDYTAAKRAGLDFVFVYGWTEVVDWREFVKEIQRPAVRDVTDFLCTVVSAER